MEPARGAMEGLLAGIAAPYARDMKKAQTEDGQIRAQLRNVAVQRRAVEAALVRKPLGERGKGEAALKALAEAERHLRARLAALPPVADEIGAQRQPSGAATRCTQCRQWVKPSKGAPIKAHLDPSGTGAWCGGGAEPTIEQRQAALRKGKGSSTSRFGRSVRTVSAGLPGLGRRR